MTGWNLFGIWICLSLIHFIILIRLMEKDNDIYPWNFDSDEWIPIIGGSLLWPIGTAMVCDLLLSIYDTTFKKFIFKKRKFYKPPVKEVIVKKAIEVKKVFTKKNDTNINLRK